MSEFFDVVDAIRPGLLNDAFTGFILGQKLGSGIDREVFVFKPDPAKVIKIETGAGHFQNVVEYQVWHEASGPSSDTILARYLAPVHMISVYGCFLLMERTFPPPSNFKWPDKLPRALTDFKKGNFGVTAKGKLVCHDYGVNMILANGIDNRMRKAHWWGD